MKTIKRKHDLAPGVQAPDEAKAHPKPTVAKAAARMKVKAAPTVVLASHCSVKDAAALKDSLCKATGESSAVTLDVRSLERIDTATMQLLCAFVRDRRARDQGVEWLGTSAALSEAARLLGVGVMLALPDNTAAGAAA